ncbi:hypothetical protein ACTHGU_20085 [Chitinophagaceae bacterium MMS25-I14]
MVAQKYLSQLQKAINFFTITYAIVIIAGGIHVFLDSSSLFRIVNGHTQTGSGSEEVYNSVHHECTEIGSYCRKMELHKDTLQQAAGYAGRCYRRYIQAKHRLRRLQQYGAAGIPVLLKRNEATLHLKYRQSLGEVARIKDVLRKDSIWLWSRQSSFKVHVAELKRNALAEIDEHIFRVETSLMQESVDKRELVLALLFCIVLSFPFIYVWLRFFRQSINEQFRTGTGGSSNWEYRLADRFFHELSMSATAYKCKMLDAWAEFFNSVLSLSLTFLLLLCIYIWRPISEIEKYVPVPVLFFGFFLCMVLLLLALLSYAKRLENKGLFIIKMLSGIDFLRLHLNENRKFCLYLRSFSSEAGGQSSIPLRIVKGLRGEFKDLNFDDIDAGINDEEQDEASEMGGPYFMSQLFGKIRKVLPPIHLANIQHKRHLPQLIPLYTEDHNWFSIASELINNAALIIVYYANESPPELSEKKPGIIEEIDHIYRHGMWDKTIMIVDDISKVYPYKKQNVFQNLHTVESLSKILKQAETNDRVLYDALNLDVILYQPLS